MATALLAWELGEGYGHHARLGRIAELLRARGIGVAYALRSLQNATAILGPETALWAAPFPVVTKRAMRPAAGLAGILALLGYDHGPSTAGLIRGWLNLFAATGADIVVADHAPGALLAARVAGLPAVAVGDGFEIPPDIAPLPTMSPWRPSPDAQLQEEHDLLLAGLNAALAAYQRPALDRVGQLFAEANPCVCAFAETDHYPDRTTGQVGPVFGNGSGDVPAWWDQPEPRLVAYLSGVDRGFAAMLEALATCGLPVLLHLRDVRDDQVASALALGQGRLFLSAAPLDLVRAAPAAAAVICAGGIGTTSQALLAGTPLIGIPQHSEQAMLAWRLKQIGATLPIRHDVDTTQMRTALLQAAHSAEMRAAAQAFRDRHAGYRVDTATGRIADTVARALRADPADAAG